VNGIPRFVPARNYAANFGFQWNRFRRTQLDSGTGLPISRDRFQRATGWSRDTLAGARVLDVGCGAGRFAEVALSLGASVVAIDYSSAVDACRANLTDANLQVRAGRRLRAPVRRPARSIRLQPRRDPAHAGRGENDPGARAPGGSPAASSSWTCIAGTCEAGCIHASGCVPSPRAWDGRRLFTLVERAAPVLLKVSNARWSDSRGGPAAATARPRRQLRRTAAAVARAARGVGDSRYVRLLAPAYDQPQTAGTLQRWMTDAGLTDIRVLTADHLTARGRRPGGGA
jgi:hypothetical protein